MAATASARPGLFLTSGDLQAFLVDLHPRYGEYTNALWEEGYKSVHSLSLAPVDELTSLGISKPDARDITAAAHLVSRYRLPSPVNRSLMSVSSGWVYRQLVEADLVTVLPHLHFGGSEQPRGFDLSEVRRAFAQLWQLRHAGFLTRSAVQDELVAAQSQPVYQAFATLIEDIMSVINENNARGECVLNRQSRPDTSLNFVAHDVLWSKQFKNDNLFKDVEFILEYKKSLSEHDVKWGLAQALKGVSRKRTSTQVAVQPPFPFAVCSSSQIVTALGKFEGETPRVVRSQVMPLFAQVLPDGRYLLDGTSSGYKDLVFLCYIAAKDVMEACASAKDEDFFHPGHAVTLKCGAGDNMSLEVVGVADRPRVAGGVYFVKVAASSTAAATHVLKIAPHQEYLNSRKQLCLDVGHLQQVQREIAVLRHIGAHDMEGLPQFVAAGSLVSCSQAPRMEGAAAVLTTKFGQPLVTDGGKLPILDMKDLQQLAADILEVLLFLQGKGVQHNDLCPENIAVRVRDARARYGLFDFGGATCMAAEVEDALFARYLYSSWMWISVGFTEYYGDCESLVYTLLALSGPVHTPLPWAYAAQQRDIKSLRELRWAMLTAGTAGNAVMRTWPSALRAFADGVFASAETLKPLAMLDWLSALQASLASYDASLKSMRVVPARATSDDASLGGRHTTVKEPRTLLPLQSKASWGYCWRRWVGWRRGWGQQGNYKAVLNARRPTTCGSRGKLPAATPQPLERADTPQTCMCLCVDEAEAEQAPADGGGGGGAGTATPAPGQTSPTWFNRGGIAEGSSNAQRSTNGATSSRLAHCVRHSRDSVYLQVQDPVQEAVHTAVSGVGKERVRVMAAAASARPGIFDTIDDLRAFVENLNPRYGAYTNALWEKGYQSVDELSVASEDALVSMGIPDIKAKTILAAARHVSPLRPSPVTRQFVSHSPGWVYGQLVAADLVTVLPHLHEGSERPGGMDISEDRRGFRDIWQSRLACFLSIKAAFPAVQHERFAAQSQPVNEALATLIQDIMSVFHDNNSARGEFRCNRRSRTSTSLDFVANGVLWAKKFHNTNLFKDVEFILEYKKSLSEHDVKWGLAQALKGVSRKRTSTQVAVQPPFPFAVCSSSQIVTALGKFEGETPRVVRSQVMPLFAQVLPDGRYLLDGTSSGYKDLVFVCYIAAKEAMEANASAKDEDFFKPGHAVTLKCGASDNMALEVIEVADRPRVAGGVYFVKVAAASTAVATHVLKIAPHQEYLNGRAQLCLGVGHLQQVQREIAVLGYIGAHGMEGLPQLVAAGSLVSCSQAPRMEGAAAVLTTKFGQPLVTDGGQLPILDMKDLQQLAADILEVLLFLQGKGVQHNDLCPENIAVRVRDGRARYGLFDFGGATCMAAEVEDALFARYLYSSWMWISVGFTEYYGDCESLVYTLLALSGPVHTPLPWAYAAQQRDIKSLRELRWAMLTAGTAGNAVMRTWPSALRAFADGVFASAETLKPLAMLDWLSALQASLASDDASLKSMRSKASWGYCWRRWVGWRRSWGQQGNYEAVLNARRPTTVRLEGKVASNASTARASLRMCVRACVHAFVHCHMCACM
eukprot:jgi/Chlat1/8014/Chrsp7S07780